MGMIGGILRATSGNGVSVTKKVKNTQLQGLLNNEVSDYSATRQSGQAALGDYISQYLSRSGDAKKFGQQEEQAVGDYYNGNLSNRLSALRQSRQQAVTSAADVAVGQAQRSVAGQSVGNDGGPSSYDQRLAIGAMAPIRAQAAVDNANQERADLGYVTQGQLDLAGKRNDIINRTAGYGLVPEMARRQMQNQDVGFLGNLLQSDQLNHFYGLKQDTNKWADIMDSADQGIMNAASIYSSVGGGMKRGGLVRDYEGGGKVRGPGTATSDSIHAKLSNGEFVMPAVAVKMPGVLPMLEHIRQMALRDSTEGEMGGEDGKHFASGGVLNWVQDMYHRYIYDPRANDPANRPEYYSSAPSENTAPYGYSFARGGPVGGRDGRHFFNGGDVSAANTLYAQQIAQTTSAPAPTSSSPSKSSGGGGGGGLSGQAMALQARVDRNLMAQWFPSSSTFGSAPAPDFVAPGMEDVVHPARFGQQRPDMEGAWA